jgi:hypothetical protein
MSMTARSLISRMEDERDYAAQDQLLRKYYDSFAQG